MLSRIMVPRDPEALLETKAALGAHCSNLNWLLYQSKVNPVYVGSSFIKFYCNNARFICTKHFKKTFAFLLEYHQIHVGHENSNIFSLYRNPNGGNLHLTWHPYSRSHPFYMLFGAGQVDVSSRLYNMRRIQTIDDTVREQTTQISTTTTNRAEINKKLTLFTLTFILLSKLVV